MMHSVEKVLNFVVLVENYNTWRAHISSIYVCVCAFRLHNFIGCFMIEALLSFILGTSPKLNDFVFPFLKI